VRFPLSHFARKSAEACLVDVPSLDGVFLHVGGSKEPTPDGKLTSFIPHSRRPCQTLIFELASSRATALSQSINSRCCTIIWKVLDLSCHSNEHLLYSHFVW
jgi:hypothetical protein